MSVRSAQPSATDDCVTQRALWRRYAVDAAKRDGPLRPMETPTARLPNCTKRIPADRFNVG